MHGGTHSAKPYSCPVIVSRHESHAGGEQEAQSSFEEAHNAVFNLQLTWRHMQPHCSRRDGKPKWSMIEMWPMHVRQKLLYMQLSLSCLKQHTPHSHPACTHPASHTATHLHLPTSSAPTLLLDTQQPTCIYLPPLHPPLPHHQGTPCPPTDGSVA